LFGFVVADRSGLSPEQVARYRACYCGLCRTIGQRHGQLSRLSLTYDMTFLVLLLDSLYEPDTDQTARRCAVHPAQRQLQRVSRYTEYAADLNVALAYYNCLDDWQDDRSLPKLAFSRALAPGFRRARERWPEQCRRIVETLDKLNALERARSGDLDRASGLFGGLMAALFAPEQDRWTETLRQLGDSLGRFIYVMDACLDREADAKRGSYNPVTEFERVNGPFDSRMSLTMLIGDCAMAFERLPLEQDLDLLRNILYSGVWSRWRAAHSQEATEDKQP
jgi:hypothetical protein